MHASQARPRALRRLATVTVLVASFAASGLVTETAAPAAPASSVALVGPPVTGTVFRDFDQDGVRDPLEPGQAGVTVTATDPAGGTVSAVSGPDGSYSLTVSGLPSSRVRVVFSGWPAYLEPSAHGAGNGTDVQLVDAGGTADFGVTNPAQFCSANAELATTCFQGGTATANGPAVVAFPQDAGTASTTSNNGAASSSRGEGMASHSDLAFDDVVGPVRGLAWQRSTQTIFAAAYAKRHTAYPGGPDNTAPGTIYAVPRGGGAPSVLFTANAGPDQHAYGNLVADAGFWDQVGRSGWGDIDLSEDEQTLYAANMFDRLVYAVPVTGTPPTAGPATTIDLAPLASADCGGNDWVPGGIKARDGLVYLSATCTAATSQLRPDLRGLVYSYDPATGDLAQVASFPLNYARGPVSAQNAPSAWLPWSATEQTRPSPTDPNPFGQVYYPQPWLTDVEFDEAGRMLLGVTDRAGDQFGNDNGAGPSGNNEGVAAGDTLILPAAAGGTWSPPVGGDVLGSEQYPLTGPTHTEITLGHLAVRLGSGSVISNAFDPAPVGGPVRTTDGSTVLFPQSFRSGGLISMSTQNGSRTRSYQLFGIDSPGTFGKAAGVGDIELLCDAAPLEIGDYVWIDTDGDGQQDADENPIPGATVRLYDAGGTLVATTTTDATGRWYFPADPNTSYTVRLDNPADYAPGGPLEGLILSPADAGDDASDSDATTVAGFPRIPVTTGGPGANDHDLDTGFTVPYSLGNQLWIDADKDGVRDPGEAPVPGATVELLDAAGNPVLDATGAPVTTTTDANGLYLFEGLPPGEYVVSVPASNFASGGPLAGYESTPPTSTDPDDDVDNDDNGAPGPGGSVRSGPIILGPGEPTGEDPDNDTSTVDDHSNLTVDFGFVPITYSLGNQVWIDTDRDGRIDPGERAVPGVTVALLDPQGNPVRGPNGQPLTATTDANGLYLFTGLPPGDYVVSIPASNFATGGPLAGYESTPPTSADPDDNVDNDDNGTPGPGGSVRSGTVTLGPGEPTGETPGNDPGTPDTRSNLTVDFGFVQTTYSLGNQVWIDTDRDGRIDPGERTVPGVRIALLDVQGNPILGPGGQPLTTTTDADGLYLFTGLAPGDYVVSIVAANFADGGPLDGYLSTPPTSDDPDDNVDGDDNGSPRGDGSVRSGPITLGPGEPTGETPGNDPGTPDAQSNLTVDFGFVKRISDLAVDKRLVGDLVAGATARYELTVTNRGPDTTDSQIVVEDRERTGLDLTAAEGDGWRCSVAAELVTCRYDDMLREGDSVSVLVESTVSAAPGAEVVNGARVRLVDQPPSDDPGDVPDTVDPNPDNDTDTVTTVAKDPDVGGTPEDPGEPGDPGDGPDIPDAGSDVPGWLLWLAGGSLLSGAGLLWRARRESA
jgi:SdrD B-like domain/Domain of unknown function DUF11